MSAVRNSFYLFFLISINFKIRSLFTIFAFDELALNYCY
jgi:hypothetical protein